jgi:glyoxylate utilization-related uncharacterized protein
MTEIQLIDIPNAIDARGQVTFMETGAGCPFRIKRVFWMTAVPRGQSRGGHAHIKCRQILIAVAGLLHVIIGGKTFLLNDPAVGLYIPPRVRIDICNFSKGAVCLVLASDQFDAEDYI